MNFLWMVPLSGHIRTALPQKRGLQTKSDTAEAEPAQKIHAIVDAYGYSVHLMISEGQKHDITFALPMLSQIDIEGSQVLADKGYDSNKLIDYIYAHRGEPTIPSRKGAKFERHCDWWLYKERHLVEKLFLKLKAYRRIATHYDNLHVPIWDFCVLPQY